VDLATNCYGCHVLQKALDCEEDIRLLIVSELLLGDPAQTLVNKHASHVWSKVSHSKLQILISSHDYFRSWNYRGRPLPRPSLHSKSVLQSKLPKLSSSISRHSVNKSLKGKWASLACHETGSLVVQVSCHCFVDVILSDYCAPC